MAQPSNKDTGASIGTISEEELQILALALEEERRQDQDCWIDHATLDAIEISHPNAAALVARLRALIGDSDGIEISYSRA